MDDYTIRLLTGDDLEEALRLSSTAGWNQRLEDWGMLVSLAPGSSFAAVSRDRVVGTAIGIDYGLFSWIAMMLVEPAWRGRGLGRRLLEAALDAVPPDRPVRLDATPMGRPLYSAHGFEDEVRLTRHVLAPDAHLRPAEPSGEGPDVRQIAFGTLGDIVEEDTRVFGGRRRQVLEWALHAAPQYAYLAASDDGVPQYCFGRRGRLFDQIGPVVAASDAAARALAGSAMAAAPGRAVVIDAFDEQARFAAWLGTCGFRAERPLFRMRRPPMSGTRPLDVPQRTRLAELAIFGPEFA